MDANAREIYFICDYFYDSPLICVIEREDRTGVGWE